MVFVGNIKDASYLVKNCDEVWAIVRSLKTKQQCVILDEIPYMLCKEE